MSAILGTFVKIGTMADGTPRIVLDLQCTLSEIAAMGLIPGVPFGLARITGESTLPNGGESSNTQSPTTAKQRPGQLCVMAVTFCNDPLFHDWAGARSEEEAKTMICSECGIESRKDLDSDQAAAQIFLTQIRGPFLAWKEAQS